MFVMIEATLQDKAVVILDLSDCYIQLKVEFKVSPNSLMPTRFELHFWVVLVLVIEIILTSCFQFDCSRSDGNGFVQTLEDSAS